jgi:hypothetical protein
LRSAALIHFHLHRPLGFGACLSEHRVCRQRLVIQFRYQVGVTRVVVLPDLADLNLADRHITNVKGFAQTVNTAELV